METAKPTNLRLLSNKQSKAHAFSVPQRNKNVSHETIRRHDANNGVLQNGLINLI